MLQHSRTRDRSRVGVHDLAGDASLGMKDGKDGKGGNYGKEEE
jgi:hypothetical protein